MDSHRFADGKGVVVVGHHALDVGDELLGLRDVLLRACVDHITLTLGGTVLALELPTPWSLFMLEQRV